MTSKSDWHVISPYSISLEPKIKVTIVKEWLSTKEAFDCETNSSFQHLRICIENSMENKHIDHRV